MADIIRKATNKFGKGLIMDFSPENTRNEVLTHALNATLLTFNGNELSLQNDMGNARVETAYLPEGYIPVGTCEYGGIIYIVSYNPLEDKSQIGCFPSPERNVSNKELGIADAVINREMFQEFISDKPTGKIINNTQCVILKNDKLNPGDKFLVCADNSIYNERLKDLFKGGEAIEDPIIALNIVSIEDSGKIVYLNSEVRQYVVGNNSYHIVGSSTSGGFDQTTFDPDSYRNTLSSGYNVFRSKTSGKLAILAELIMIDTYSVTHSLQKVVGNDGSTQDNKFNIVIHTEVSPEITTDTTNPKLKYYHLEKSEGYLQLFDDRGNESRKKLSDSGFLSTKISDIYTPTGNEIEGFDASIGDTGSFEFPSALSYHEVGDTYNDVRLAGITIPEIIVNNGLDLPFKYDYTLVPCMSYGKLQHLAVSNTVDFSKLHAFNQSNFTTWKYRIDGDQLRLTFGADVFDTYEDTKVDGLVLEFYDLWGFAGSLEILDKKSYSGIFTKILSLNSLGTLSTKKIGNGNYYEDFHHNIDIREINGTFYLNENPVTFDSDKGWLDSSGNPIIANDCGTLYSNILYGVKAYLRRTLADGTKEFIKKREFFLYTLPIYNDYYYTVNDFSALSNPQLDLVLTYKLVDNSNREAYSRITIKDGYSTEDSEKVNLYLQGNYEDESFNVIKYFKYKGTSDLYLEIGLKKDYQDLNISYSAAINNYFSCKLALVSNDSTDRPYSVISENNVGNISQVLNYYNRNNEEILSTSVNKIGFGGKMAPGISINKSDFINKNFINNVGSQPLDINYEFVVGYSINVTNIASDLVPTTTICALYHQDPNGNYNEKDFGVYINNSEYLSNAMFYNDGTSEEEIFGICQQISIEDGEVMNKQCTRVTSVTTDAQPIIREGLLNAGDPLKALVPYIGKLTFCQPHAHGLSGVNGVNIHNYVKGDANYLGVSSSDIKSGGFDYGSADDKDGAAGITPRLDLYENPKYNMCLNTQKSIQYFGEFISTLDYDEVEGRIWSSNYSNTNETKWHSTFYLRNYTGFTGKQLSIFNRCLLNTMSKVYAYNPDYDSLEVKVGNVQVTDNPIAFTSNLINTDSRLVFPEGITFNNFIYLGPFCFSDYLQHLNARSSIQVYDSYSKPLPQVQLTPNYTYCGTPEQYYLISSLTYNTSTPQSIEDELAFKGSDFVVVKHSDGTNIRVTGVPNTKTLYGYNSTYNKLVQLDVSNYSIDDNGYLKLKDDDITEVKNITLEGKDCAMILANITEGHTFEYEFTDSDKTEEVPITVKLNLKTILQTESNNVYFASTAVNKTIKIIATSTNKKYSINVGKISLEGEYKGLRASKFTISDESSKYNLCNAGKEVLSELIYDGLQKIHLKIGENTGDRDYSVSELWVYPDPNNNYIMYEGQGFTSEFEIDNGKDISFYPLPSTITTSPSNSVIGLGRLTLKSIELTLTRTTAIKNYPNSFVPVKPTESYASIETHKYKVSSSYENARLRGTSITLNDLVYVPNIDGHRLFVKDGLCTYDDTHRGKIYYRYYKEVPSDGEYAHDSWEYDETKNLNCLFIYTGPCFTTDNLPDE